MPLGRHQEIFAGLELGNRNKLKIRISGKEKVYIGASKLAQTPIPQPGQGGFLEGKPEVHFFYPGRVTWVGGIPGIR